MLVLVSSLLSKQALKTDDQQVWGPESYKTFPSNPLFSVSSNINLAVCMSVPFTSDLCKMVLCRKAVAILPLLLCLRLHSGPG